MQLSEQKYQKLSEVASKILNENLREIKRVGEKEGFDEMERRFLLNILTASSLAVLLEASNEFQREEMVQDIIYEATEGNIRGQVFEFLKKWEN